MQMFADLLSETAKLKPETIPYPPVELIQFRALKLGDKMRNGPSFFNQPFIKDYLENKWRAEVHNISTFKNLFEQLETAKEEDKPLYTDLLKTFKHAIKTSPDPFKALAMDFSKYIFEEDCQLKTALDMFGGSVVN